MAENEGKTNWEGVGATVSDAAGAGCPYNRIYKATVDQ